MTSNRAALVTGGSSGIGLAIAAVLAEEGYALTLCGRRQDRLDAATAMLRERGADVATHAANMANEAAPADLVAFHEARFNRLDVVVHSAGIGFYGPLATRRPPDLNLEIALNLRAPHLLLQAALPLLSRAGAEHGKATVVFVSSYNGIEPAPQLASYAATKAGLVMLSRSAQAEVGELGIQVTALCPGYVDTPMSDYWRETVDKEAMLRPQDLGEAVRFLLRTSRACRVPEIVLARGGGGL